MHHKKLKNLLSLNDRERYDFFIRDVVQFERVWTVGNNDGFFIIKDTEGDQLLLIWPHKELAEDCCYSEHRDMGGSADSIELDIFLKRCIPDMIEDNISFGVFFNKERSGLMVKGNVLLKDITEEYEEIWE